MRRGAIAILPFALGAAIYGFAFGVVAAQAGFAWWAVALMSASVFAGSSQIVAVDRFAADGLVLGAAVAGMALNLRYLGILASLHDVLGAAPLARRLLSIHLTSDENWALTMAMRSQGAGAGFLLGSGLVLLVVWTAATALGALAGQAVPELGALGIGFAFTAAFIAMARALWRGRADALPFAVAFGATFGLGAVGVAGAGAILGGAALGTAAAALRTRT